MNQQDNGIKLNEFLDLAENDKTNYDGTAVFDVIVDGQRYKCPFLLVGEFNINDGEPFRVSITYKDSDELTKSIEKMIDKYDETLKVLFSGCIKKKRIINVCITICKEYRINFINLLPCTLPL